jgi:hypothetical protein
VLQWAIVLTIADAGELQWKLLVVFTMAALPDSYSQLRVLCMLAAQQLS